MVAGAVALFLPQGPRSLAAGILGGMAWAAVPALLKTRFNPNEILVSLMLTYVAALLLDCLVRGPLDPESREYSSAYLVPVLVDGTRLHLGLFLAVAVAVAFAAALAVMMRRTMRGFSVRVIGAAPCRCLRRLFRQRHGPVRAAAPWRARRHRRGFGHHPSASAGDLGRIRLAAIIVAFLGRLTPPGAIFARSCWLSAIHTISD